MATRSLATVTSLSTHTQIQSSHVVKNPPNSTFISCSMCALRATCCVGQRTLSGLRTRPPLEPDRLPALRRPTGGQYTGRHLRSLPAASACVGYRGQPTAICVAVGWLDPALQIFCRSQHRKGVGQPAGCLPRRRQRPPPRLPAAGTLASGAPERTGLQSGPGTGPSGKPAAAGTTCHGPLPANSRHGSPVTATGPRTATEPKGCLCCL